jgi:hypothetical protein
MLGSLSEADDAVQEAWLRLSRSDAGAIENLGGWLTTVVGHTPPFSVAVFSAYRACMASGRMVTGLFIRACIELLSL